MEHLSEHLSQPGSVKGQIRGLVHSTESFGSVDGPGIRFLIFLQGCPLRCRFCHNPDTWTLTSGQALRVSADQLLAQALRYRPYWGKGGGITVSGGEPLLQIDFLVEFFRKAKEACVHTALDTSGAPFTREEPFYSRFLELMKYVDLVLLDLKMMDPAGHLGLTGRGNDNILDMARLLDELGVPVWIRHVLVPGLTDKETDLREMDAFIRSLANVERVEVLPYHTLGVYKWKELGIPYSLEDVLPPSAEEMEKAGRLLHADC
uniref:pyruvate formate-lyase-activating protein n=1 Tax=Lachnoclostridium phocaeense TaxID=1871021 RepID=UPI0026DB77E3|nr:pyruvate formate-lyase-activating protein [Lachnoclostridium phocaeense]